MADGFLTRIYRDSRLAALLYDRLSFVRLLVRLYRAGHRKLTLLRNKLATQEVTKERIIRDLRRIGLREGDVVLVHPSLNAIGYVAGGADAVIDALLETVGEAGTVVVPVMSLLPTDFLGGRMPVFDVAATPAYTGKIPETLRRREGAVRSIHPTHSLAAIGRHSSYLMRDHEKWLTPFGNDTPYGKLYDRDAFILFIGVDHSVNTCVHMVEDRAESFPYKVYLDGTFEVRIRDQNGSDKTMRTKVHNPEVQKFRDVNKLEKHFKDYGVIRFGKIGNADGRIIKLRDQIRVMEEVLKQGITIYTFPPSHTP